MAVLLQKFGMNRGSRAAYGVDYSKYGRVDPSRGGGVLGNGSSTLTRNSDEYNYDGSSLDVLIDDQVRLNSIWGAGFEPAVANLLPFKDFDSGWEVNASVNYRVGGVAYFAVNYTGTGASTNTLDEDSVRSAASARSAKIVVTNAGDSSDDVRLDGRAIAGRGVTHITNGTDYTVSFYTKTSEAKTGLTLISSSGGLSTTFNTTTEYTKIEATFTSNATATNTILSWRIGNKGTFDFYIDAISFEESSFASSRWIGGDAAVGADLGTDSDCSGGTLTTGAGWAHDGGNNEYDATASSADLSDDTILTAGTVYRVKVVYANDVGGSFVVKLGTQAIGSAIDADGTYYFYGIANDVNLVFDATGLTGSIQSYEVKAHGSVGVSESAQLSYTLPTTASGGALFAETLGAEINSGTLTLGLLYNITADTGGDFYAGSAVDEYFVSDGTETADGDSKVKNVTNAYDSGTGLLPPHATVMAWVRFGYVNTVQDEAGEGTNSGIVAVTTSRLSLMYNSNTGGTPIIKSFEGTNNPADGLVWAADTLYKLVVQYGYLTSNVLQFRIGIDTGSGISWGTAATYDGAYTTGTDLILAHTPFGPIWIQKWEIYPSILSDEKINALGSP